MAAGAQQPEPEASAEDASRLPPLTLRSRIALPGVYGRMDHYGWDSKRGILFVTALGNNTVEIVDQWKRVGSISALEHPQASQYVPGFDRLAVSSQSGKLRFYEAASYTLMKTLDFGADADTDNLRYDAAGKLLYVGYGEGQRGALAAVDAATMERVQDYPLGSHPESFQLARDGSRIFVNLPDQEAIAVIDRNTGRITKWPVVGDKNSHTLAFDEAGHRLFTAALQPGQLTVVDSDRGNVVVKLPCVLGVDDLWYDAARKRVYATGAGAIDVIQQRSADSYVAMAKIAVGPGSGSTSLHLKSRTQDGLYVSWPNMLPQGGSEVLLYYIND
jgi:DNA-binding beta-propeller fold protein YncE